MHPGNAARHAERTLATNHPPTAAGPTPYRACVADRTDARLVAPPTEPVGAGPSPAAWPDADLDPEYPDLDGIALRDETVALPDARTLALLRCELTDVVLDVDPEVPIEVHDSVVAGVDLTGRRIEGITRSRLERCRLGGVDLGDASVRDVTFHDCVLDLSAWRGATVERVVVAGGRFDGVDLSGARLTDVVLGDVSLTDVVLDRVRFERVDLTATDLTAVRDVASLRGCTISATQASVLAARLAAGLGLHVRADG